ncbi:MAG: GNAT family N-acetyltransferase [Planctomycetes bacterium]|nr:GNAT family N-acetyltransferase [Planctomycetota bacterium]
MFQIENIDDRSPQLEAVRRLWRAHSATLGFLPEGAFVEYAAQRHIIVALRDQECVGYVLYRIVRDQVTIAHFCVAPDARKQGIARALLSYLVRTTQRYRGIVLSCRRDFEAGKTWPRLGFHAAAETAGRAVDGSELVRWVLDYGHADIFSEADETRLEVVIDANIFLDLVDGRHEETQGLRADWLQPLIVLCYTTELFNEINRNDDAAARKRRKAEIQQFRPLRCTPVEFQDSVSLLQPLFPTPKSSQDESDFRHLARALAAGADAFVTRDGKLLDRAEEVFEVCGLSVVRPADLIGRVDVLQHERNYQRRFVGGTRGVVQERIRSIDDELLLTIQASGEQKNGLANMLNTYLADPPHYDCHKISAPDGATLAAFVVERRADVDYVRVLRIAAKRRAGSLVRAVLRGIIRQSLAVGSRAVFVAESALDATVSSACADLGFLPVVGGRLKILLTGQLTIEAAVESLHWPDPKIDELRAALPLARADAAAASRIEHTLFPAKLIDAALPTFVVPIKPQFAEHLFDERIAGNGLFGADVDLALNLESAYYRAARPCGVSCPARILWYVTEADNYPESKTIRSCSRLVELVVDTPKALYSRFRRLGVYDWSHVRETAGGDLGKKIMAFRFDDSEPLKPVGWTKFHEILRTHDVKSNNLRSPLEVPARVFGDLYAAAVDSPAVRGCDLSGNEALRTASPTTSRSQHDGVDLRDDSPPGTRRPLSN